MKTTDKSVQPPTIVVVGSINMDMTIQTARIPLMGETVFGEGFKLHAGGKGANQAVASARMGIKTYLIAKMGKDLFGQSLHRFTSESGVNMDYAMMEPDVSTGVAVITVCDGDNSIIIDGGGNAQLTPIDIQARKDLILSASAILLQHEVPEQTVEETIRLAKGRVPIFLNPAPARPLPDELLDGLDWLIPNETECASLVGFTAETVQDAYRAVDLLLSKGVRHPLITLGAQGVVYFDGSAIRHESGFITQVVDTVAAGDTLVGTLAAMIADGMECADAVHFAQAAASITITRQGAQEAIPTRDEVECKLRGEFAAASQKKKFDFYG